MWFVIMGHFIRWSIARHFQYAPEIGAAFFWTLPALFRHVQNSLALLIAECLECVLQSQYASHQSFAVLNDDSDHS